MDWHKLKDLAVTNFKDLPTEPGIYFVRWSKAGKAISICRLGGVDHKGILYVGSAVKLRRRIRELWRGINGKVEAHTIGKTIIFCKTFETINLDEYEISWKTLSTHKEATGQEWIAMVSYAQKYKEPPPLNLSLRREMFAIFGVAKLGKSRFVDNPDEFVRFVIGF